MKTIKLVLVILGSLAIASCGGGGGGGGGSSTSDHLDILFGTGGVVMTDIGAGSADSAASIAIQADDKIVVAGYSVNSNDSDFALTRYSATDGNLDTTFGTDGKVITDIGIGSEDFAYSVAIQTDGKIVVAGSSGNDFALARYDANGSLDTTFGTNGVVTTDIGTGSLDIAYSVAIQTDGMIVVAGSSGNDFALTRYTAAGVLDISFSGDGVVITDIATGSLDIAESVAIQTDGKIVAAGSSGNDFALTRYTAAGVLDISFGTNGVVTTNIGTGSVDIAESVAIQTDGKIVAAGSSNNDFALARYTDTGALDSTFGTGGKVTTAIGAIDDTAYSVAIQTDGKIVAAGKTFNSGLNFDFALTRYTSAGILDTSFGAGGKVTTAIGAGTDEEAHAIAIQWDGKIVAAGFSPNNLDDDFALVRYLP